MKQKIENKHLKNISRSVLGITFCIYGMQGSRKKSSQKGDRQKDSQTENTGKQRE